MTKIYHYNQKGICHMTILLHSKDAHIVKLVYFWHMDMAFNTVTVYRFYSHHKSITFFHPGGILTYESCMLYQVILLLHYNLTSWENYLAPSHLQVTLLNPHHPPSHQVTELYPHHPPPPSHHFFPFPIPQPSCSSTCLHVRGIHS